MDRVTFEYVEGATSDLTFRAYGKGLDEVFTAAADATTAAMVDSLDSIGATTSRSVLLGGSELDLLLMKFLDELIFWKDADQLLLRATDVHVRWHDGRYEVRAELRGEKIDPAKHRIEADVKAVTLHRLRVERADDGWFAEVTLDV